MVCNIISKFGFCFKCIFKDLPSNYIVNSSGNVGILNSAVNVVAAIQTTEAIKVLTENLDSLIKGLIIIDVWDLSLEIIEIKKDINYKCPLCNK